MKRIFFTVTNDLTFDQRMDRICTTLAENGYGVTLVGRKLRSSLPLVEKKYNCKRIRCWFNKTKWFYAEYNTRLFFYLLFKRMDALCAIDLDTILPGYYISKWKKIIRIYDAHELFSELKEVITRPPVQKAWTRIERKYVPRFPLGYTVSESVAEEFHRRYGVRYESIRNMPPFQELEKKENSDRFILYQGAVNEARGLEFLVPAMQWVPVPLVICGDGNFMTQLKSLIKQFKLEHKIKLTGMLPPDQLRVFSQTAYIAVAVPEKEGLNQWYALPNKLFDYIHAGLPQVTVNYPEYQRLNNQFEVALLLESITPEHIAAGLNKLLEDETLYNKLRKNCIEARKQLNWEAEQKKIITFYQKIFRESTVQ